MQSAHLATGQRCLSIAAARGTGGSKRTLNKGRRSCLTPVCSDRSLTGRDRTTWRINTLLQDRPTKSAAPEGQRGKPAEQQSGKRRQVDASIVVSKRKQWGAVQLGAVLIDEDGNTSEPASATILTPPFSNAERQYAVKFDVPSSFGKVAALRVQPKLSVSGQHARSVFLDRVETKDKQSECIIWCHSWVSQTQGDRMFFTNEASLHHSLGPELQKLRDQELHDIKGEKYEQDASGKWSWVPNEDMRQPLERIYQYQVYDDMSEPSYDPTKPDADLKVRPVLGKDPTNPEGAGPYCYPRRLRTGRPYIPNTGKEVYTSDPYLPLDERFDERKSIAFGFNTAFSLLPWLVEQILPWRRMRELTSFDDVSFIYQNAWKALFGWLFLVPGLPSILRLNTKVMPPLPLVALGRSTLWDDDVEFGRQVVAGVNPCALEAVTDYDAWCKTSTMGDSQLKGLLEHPSLKEAIEDPERNIFVIDHATTLLSTLTKDTKSPIIEQINNQPDSEVFMYAPRCLLHKSKAGRLTPIAVELCLPHEDPLVVTANDDPLRWRLAKGHFLAANSGHHQVISHFLRTHACIEPIIIATYRCLSVMHPLNKALHPHLRFTLAINARARTGLINGAGVIETCFNPGRVAMPMSARIYADWKFEQQALPADLLARKMLVEDSAGNIKWKGKTYSIIMGEDYPYAADGMLLWNAVHDWLVGYLGTYYKTQADLDNDKELHAWWDEIKHKGHPDVSEGWPELRTLEDLVNIATTVAWLSSGHHAAVNFGQYAYTGYFPNFPTISRKRIPPIDTLEWAQMSEDHDLAFLQMFSSKKTALQVLGVVRLLSTHDAEEEYLATRPDDATWTSSTVDRGHWKAFQKSVQEAEATIKDRNNNPALKHRYMKYELLMPELGPKPKNPCGPPARGVPNSISI